VTEPILHAEGVTVELTGGDPVVEDLTLELRASEVLGLVGESGSGKTTAALALLGYARAGARIVSGSVRVGGEELLTMADDALRRRRGERIAYVPQDPGTALNPAFRVREQLREMLLVHRGAADPGRVVDVLRSVHLPSDHEFLRRFPHQLSGGQQQRLAIARALVCEPAVVVLDEPTTGLDMITQSRILAEVGRLRREHSLAIVMVSHDLAVVAGTADRIAVMYAGRVVEEGPAEQLVRVPRHPYTRGLVASVPDHGSPRLLRGIPGVAVGVGDRPPGCAFAPRCSRCTPECEAGLPGLLPVAPAHAARCIHPVHDPLEVAVRRSFGLGSALDAPLLKVDRLHAEHPSPTGPVEVLHGVSLELEGGRCLAVVGESGSGKTTLARCIVGLHQPVAGTVMLSGRPLETRSVERSREAARQLQIVFQNPYDSLNPRRTVADTLERPLRLFTGLRGPAVQQRIGELLEQVRLAPRLAGHRPAELSGGERQRVAIARALAAEPSVLICDEITSALDVSVQASVLEVLGNLRRELGLAVLFITHDLGVVASIADTVLVLESGRTREFGEVQELLAAPADEYTRRLIEAAPALSGGS
jgi:peptide/nickel transport system ATP-binding protein